MRVYVSNSLGKQEEYLLTVFILQLRDEGFVISGTTELASSRLLNQPLAYESQTAIASSDVLIGVVTKNGQTVSQINKELDFASANTIPYGLLVESGVEIKEQYHSNIFYFNRFDLEKARKAIESRREERRRFFELVNYEPGKDSKMNRAQKIAWFTVYDVLLSVLPVLSSSKISA